MNNVRTLSTFPERLAIGDAHEARVRAELEARGWVVDRYGKALLSERTRQALGKSVLRWDPDMVASARDGRVCLIDAKGSYPGAPDHTYHVDRKCLAAGRELSIQRDLPLYYVFANLGVATPFEILQFGRHRTIGDAPAVIAFSSGMVGQFDDIFGVPMANYQPMLNAA